MMKKPLLCLSAALAALVVLAGDMTSCAMSAPAEPQAIGIQVHAIKTPYAPWSIKACDLNGDSRSEILLGTIGHEICLLSYPDGLTLWKHETDGIPIALETGDLDDDGVEEVLAVCLGPQVNVILLSHEGKLLWKWLSDDNTIISAAIGDPVNDGRKMILAGGNGNAYILSARGKLIKTRSVSRHRIGSIEITDLEKDGQSETIVADMDEGITVISNTLDVKWTAGGKTEGMPMVYRFNTGDLDGDGKREIVASPRGGMIQAYSSSGETMWEAGVTNYAWGSFLVNTAVGDFNGDGRDEVFCQGGQLWDGPDRSRFYLFSGSGERLYYAEAPIAVLGVDSGDIDGDGRSEIVLAGFRDGSIHVLNVESGVEDLLGRHVSENVPLANLREHRRQLDAAKETAGAGRAEPFRVLLEWPELKWTGSGNVSNAVKLHDFLKTQSSDDLVFELGIRVAEERDLDDSERDRRLAYISRSDILETARKLEEKGIHFLFGAAHGAKPAISIELAEAALEAAPSCFRGFYVYESALGFSKSDGYLSYIKSLLKLCAKHGKQFYMIENLHAWLVLPSMKQFENLFNAPELKNVIVPFYKSNNPRCTELAVGSILGLWKSGMVGAWGVSSQSDMWRFSHYTDKSAMCPQDVMNRLSLAAASLGATHFRIEAITSTSDYLGLRPMRGAPASGLRVSPLGIDTVFTMIRKGIIRSLPPDRIVTSPVGIRIDPYRGRAPRITKDSFGDDGGLFSFKLPLQAVDNRAYASSYIYDMKHYVDGFFPATPYGFVGIFPYYADPARLAGIDSVIETNGNSILHEGETLTGPDARNHVLGVLEAAKGKLPFAAEGVFLAAQRLVNDAYQVFLIDPRHLDPRDFETVLWINLPGSDFEVRDAMTGEALTCSEKLVHLSIPAGAYRILKIVKKGE